MAVLRRPSVQARINKNLLEDMKATFATNKTEEEAERLLHHLTTGQELTKGASEAQVVAAMQTYLKEQNKLKQK